MKRKLFILTILIVAFFAFSPNVFAEDWCHTFNITMQKGDSGDEITALQTALMKEGLLNIKQPTGYFWTLTFNAVVAFQEKYADEILAPLGLTKGTGKVA
ncbi:MAG: peptidoglycan-binding domain-containing protein, partial [Patescibacteria group bacterium]